jgi:hypothetical protein
MIAGGLVSEPFYFFCSYCIYNLLLFYADNILAALYLQTILADWPLSLLLPPLFAVCTKPLVV